MDTETARALRRGTMSQRGARFVIVARGRELVKERLRRRRPPSSIDTHVDEAVRWLLAAHDAFPDGGVSHSYLIGKGWMRSYPETTGYIIPTLLNWSQIRQAPDAEERALRMADWEIEVQRPDGAIPDPVHARPVVFDTGQVIFGWIAAFVVSERPRYLEAAIRAADWLLDELDGDGVWSGVSGARGRAYNARVAWSLLELARLTGEDRFVSPAKRFLAWTLAQEKVEGWFDRNCLTDDARPLLHTIAYTARGQLESGLLLGDAPLVEAAARTATAVMERVTRDGFVAGRFDAAWRPAAPWACLTGMAQMSIVWRCLSSLRSTSVAISSERRARFVDVAERVNEFLMRMQDRSSGDAGLRGGIRGSYPVNGAYGKWRVLNWATKFFVDALLASRPDTSPTFRY